MDHGDLRTGGGTNPLLEPEPSSSFCVLGPDEPRRARACFKPELITFPTRNQGYEAYFVMDSDSFLLG